jgi:hypothetical protein
MKKLSLLALLVVAPALALAQGGPPPGKGPGAMRLFDAATVVTITGTVTGETRVDRGMGHAGVHLLVKTADGEIPVHLGPDFWVDKQTVKFAKGDEVTVKGSRITFEGKPAIIAVTVTKGGATLVLRDAQGAPAWSGQGKGPGPGAK